MDTGHGTNQWAAGAIAGVLATVLFTVAAEPIGMISMMYGFGEDAVVWGWILHLLHGAFFGLVFAGLLSLDALKGQRGSTGGSTVIGLVFGVVIWLIAASIIMPLWVGITTPMEPPVPNFQGMSFIAHSIFGIALGALYPVLRGHAHA